MQEQSGRSGVSPPEKPRDPKCFWELYSKPAKENNTRGEIECASRFG